MSSRKSHATSFTVIPFVLTITFGLLAAVVAFAALRDGPFELRSRAATESVILKEWLFDAGKDGWTDKQFGTSAVANGTYTLNIGSKTEEATREQVCTGSEKRKNYKCRIRDVINPTNPSIVNKAVQTVLKSVDHALRVRMAISIPSRVEQGQASVSPRVLRVTKVPLTVTYRLQGRSAFEPPLTFVTDTDGIVHEYVVTLPKQASLKRVEEISISFTQLRKEAGARIDIADISLIGVQEVVQPQVTTTACRPLPVTCLNASGSLECKKLLMDGSGWCVPTVTPAPNECYYQRVVCIKAPCDPLLVCPDRVSPAPVVVGNCKRGGCNGELCLDPKAEDMVSICLFREEYACYNQARCEQQSNGRCGWTFTSEYLACVATTEASGGVTNTTKENSY